MLIQIMKAKHHARKIDWTQPPSDLYDTLCAVSTSFNDEIVLYRFYQQVIRKDIFVGLSSLEKVKDQLPEQAYGLLQTNAQKEWKANIESLIRKKKVNPVVSYLCYLITHDELDQIHRIIKEIDLKWYDLSGFFDSVASYSLLLLDTKAKDLQECIHLYLSRGTILRYQLDKSYDGVGKFTDIFNRYIDGDLSTDEFRNELDQWKLYWPKSMRKQVRLQPVILETYLRLVDSKEKFDVFMSIFRDWQLSNKFVCNHRITNRELNVINDIGLSEIHEMTKRFYRLMETDLTVDQLLFIYCSTPLNFYIPLDEVLTQINPDEDEMIEIWDRGIRLNVEILNHRGDVFECKQLNCFKSILVRIKNPIPVELGNMIYVKIISYQKDTNLFEGVCI